MKKVRFETPKKLLDTMDDRDCHSPRPFIKKSAENNRYELNSNCSRPIQFINDPVHLYENSNCSPYPTVNKTNITGSCALGPWWSPSNDLDLSMLDSTNHEPWHPSRKFEPVLHKPLIKHDGPNFDAKPSQSQVLRSIENENKVTPPNVLCKDNDFFIKSGNIDKFLIPSVSSLKRNFDRLSLDKENNPLVKKAEIMGLTNVEPVSHNRMEHINVLKTAVNNDCMCHHCAKVVQRQSSSVPMQSIQCIQNHHNDNNHRNDNSPKDNCHNHCHFPSPHYNMTCANFGYNVNPVKSHSTRCSCTQTEYTPPQNAVDKKTWAIEKYEQSKNGDCTAVEKQTNVSKEKREPTVSDLFKIIKLQNEQLQLLQEKVDKFIASQQGAHSVQVQPLQNMQNFMTKQVALDTVDTEHKISIGVMTSFEMVRTSTVINKEIVTHTKDNAQIQCNRSHISIKEVVAKSQPVTLNFLEGIAPVEKNMLPSVINDKNDTSISEKCALKKLQPEHINEEKTFNEISLYNVQVDNATTPLLSPEQSLYLDVRDYSDSDSGSGNQSNVGWTYYNKVMTHVNGMLQDSDMPSSASALCRQTRQQCVQMQFDKANISVTKRVKFGDDPLGIQQPHIYTPSSDTSLKMNQLAAKYLKNGPTVVMQQTALKQTAGPVDMSFATRNYMERHQLYQGQPITSKSPLQGEMPRFLDITALKQQSKLL